MVTRPLVKVERVTLNDAEHQLDIASNLSKSGLKIELPQDRWIKKIGLMLEGQYDTGGSTPVLAIDNPLGVIGDVTVEVAGKAARQVSFPLLHYLNVFDYYGVVPTRVKTSTSISQSNLKFAGYAEFNFCTEPSFANTHPSTIDALLPAHKVSSVNLKVNTNAVTDIASNTTLDSCTLTPYLEVITMDKATEEELYGKDLEKLLYIVQSQTEKTLTAATGFKYEVDLPTGNILRRSLIEAIDNSVRSNAIITDFMTKVPLLEIEDSWSWTAAQEDDRMGLGIGRLTGMGELEATSTSAIVRTLTGLVMNDYRDLGHLDLRGLAKGSAKFKANVGSPTGTSKVKMVHEELLPWTSRKQA